MSVFNCARPAIGRPISAQKRMIEPPLTAEDIIGMRCYPPQLRSDWLAELMGCLKPSDQLFAKREGLDDAERIEDSGVYFLFSGDDLVYVGRAQYIGRRIGQHRYPNAPNMTPADWFDSMSWLAVPEHHLTRVESLYLHLYQPPYNRAIGHNRELFESLVQSRKKRKRRDRT